MYIDSFCFQCESYHRFWPLGQVFVPIVYPKLHCVQKSIDHKLKWIVETRCGKVVYIPDRPSTAATTLCEYIDGEIEQLQIEEVLRIEDSLFQGQAANYKVEFRF